jgi:ElaB/YqjD/DUF883 family membrane-anchored ribosome-binding protein
MDLERIAKLEAQVEGIKEDVKDLKADVKEVHSRITTGNREIVQKLEEVEERMRQNSLDSLKQHEEIKVAYSQDIKKVSDRVSALEQWKWYVIGVVAAIGYLIGHLEVITKFLK